MDVRPRLLAVAVFALAGAGGGAQADCRLNQTGEIPVTVNGLRPMAVETINGHDAHLVLDIGAVATIIFPEARERLGLAPETGGSELQSSSNGRAFKITLARAREATLAGRLRRDVEFVTPEQGGGEAGVDGFLGLSDLGDGDLEIDLANGVVRLFSPQGCAGADAAYWAKGKAVSAIESETPTARSPRTFGIARVNGVFVRVLFDTGTPVSHLTAAAAARAGVRAGDPGVSPASGVWGVGQSGAPLPAWIATFERLQIGDEEARDLKLKVVEKPNANADMILGADFFLTHRVFIAKSQSRIYFTRNGDSLFASDPSR